jgi:single-strand DNA-binding protein
MSRHRHSLTYDLYLHSPLWRLRRRIWILRAGGRCERCGTRRRLTIHHRNYKRLVHERREDIQVLCWPCHQHVQHGTAPARQISRVRVAAVFLFFALVAYALGRPPTTPPHAYRGHGEPPITQHRQHVPNLRRPGRISLRPDDAPPPGPAASRSQAPFPSPHGLGSARPNGGADGTRSNHPDPHKGGTMNSVQLIGRLTRDPELRSAQNGTEVGGLRLAIQRPKRDGEDQGADYVDVTTFGRQAQVCAEYLGKGRRIGVQGRLKHSEWEAEDGSKRSKLEVIANQVDFLDSPRDSGSDEAPADAEPVEAAA